MFTNRNERVEDKFLWVLNAGRQWKPSYMLHGYRPRINFRFFLSFIKLDFPFTSHGLMFFFCLFAAGLLKGFKERASKKTRELISVDAMHHHVISGDEVARIGRSIFR